MVESTPLYGDPRWPCINVFQSFTGHLMLTIVYVHYAHLLAYIY